MTQTKIEAAKQTLAAYEGHKKALAAIEQLGTMIEQSNAAGIRIKANRKSNGAQVVVMVEDLGPAFEAALFEAIHAAIEFHKEAIEEMEADGPQDDTCGTPTVVDTDAAIEAGTPKP